MRLFMYLVGILALAPLGGAALSQEATTDCMTTAGVTHCVSKSKAPLDYGATLRGGEALVPRLPERLPERNPPLAEPLPARTATGLIRSGGELLTACEDREPACITFIEGVRSGFDAGLGIAGASARVCLPKGTTAGAMRDQVVSLLLANPSSKTEDAGALTAIALMKAFPCSVAGRQ